jgi:hypothetical protein
MYKSRDVEEGIVAVTGEPVGNCFREYAFRGLLLDLA